MSPEKNIPTDPLKVPASAVETTATGTTPEASSQPTEPLKTPASAVTYPEKTPAPTSGKYDKKEERDEVLKVKGFWRKHGKTILFLIVTCAAGLMLFIGCNMYSLKKAKSDVLEQTTAKMIQLEQMIAVHEQKVKEFEAQKKAMETAKLIPPVAKSSKGDSTPPATKTPPPAAVEKKDPAPVVLPVFEVVAPVPTDEDKALIDGITRDLEKLKKTPAKQHEQEILGLDTSQVAAMTFKNGPVTVTSTVTTTVTNSEKGKPDLTVRDAGGKSVTLDSSGAVVKLPDMEIIETLKKDELSLRYGIDDITRGRVSPPQMTEGVVARCYQTFGSVIDVVVPAGPQDYKIPRQTQEVQFYCKLGPMQVYIDRSK